MKIAPLIFFLFVPLVSYSQNNDVQLANEYYAQGEYEKAKKLYEGLSRDYSSIPLIHNNYFFMLMDLGEYEQAGKYITRLIKKFPQNLYYKLDRGLLMLNRGDQAQADQYFKQLIGQVASNRHSVRIASQYFVNKRLTSYAVTTFKQSREITNSPNAHALEMANIYRIMNEKDLMVEEYLNYVSQNPSNLNYVKNTLQNLLTKPEELQSLENLLYTKIQNNPDSEIYGELLIWANLQQKNFMGAFIQARAIDKRLQTEGSRSINIGLIALDNDDYENAIKIFTYVTQQYTGTYSYTLAKMYLIRSYEKQVRNTYPVDKNEIRKLIGDYNNFISESGINRNTLEALRNKALLHAFYLDEKDSAIHILQKIIDAPRASAKIKAQSKLDLGDIYLLTGQPWEATLLYSQVEKSQKDEPLGYEAKLKNAKLSYYKGDFKLAEEHLDILKEATTREISNDAISLSLLIKENIAYDSTAQAMKDYAAIDLLLFQNKTDSALASLQVAKQKYKRHSLTDDFLWTEAGIHKEQGNFDAALQLYEQIANNYQYDIWSDDAYFMIGDIYDRQLHDKDKAMGVYRDFLTKYPGSVYVAEARKRYRELRGDFNQQEEKPIN